MVRRRGAPADIYIVDPREKTDVPLEPGEEVQADFYEDDSVPLEMFAPYRAREAAAESALIDPAASTGSAGGESEADLLLPRSTELWPEEVAPADTAAAVEEAAPVVERRIDPLPAPAKPEPPAAVPIPAVEASPRAAGNAAAATYRPWMAEEAAPPQAIKPLPPAPRVESRPAPPAPAAPTRAATPGAASQRPPRPDAPLAAVRRSLAALEQLLAQAAERGANTLYLAVNARPSIRVHGEVHALEGAAALSRTGVETLLRSLMIAHQPESIARGGAAEWNLDLPGAGRVRCMTFRDHRGPGAVLRIAPRRPISVEQLGLSREVQSLAFERDGLILVTGPRSSGKWTVIAGLLDLINRTRRAYVITLEREVNVSPEGEGSFFSQREVRGGLDEMLAIARGALRENPDVLVLQELRSAALINLAFDAAASGQLVIAGFTAPSTSEAIERIVRLYPRESARAVHLQIAQHLRAVIGQVLVPTQNGGRVAAREVLLNTSAVATQLADGKVWQLPAVLEAGRTQGMVPFADALAELVRAGSVEAYEAYRNAPDRPAFLEALKRHGIDPSAAQRQA